MTLLRRAQVSLLLVSLGTVCQAQVAKPTHLSDYIQAHPWDVSKDGPLIAIDVAKVPQATEDPGIAAFHRKVVKLGSLTVLAPDTMAILDANFQDPPDIYDGIPVNEKMDYLMSTFSGEQWKIASASGIGLSDLTRDQALVFRSIIPQKLSWIEATVGGGIASVSPEKTLAPGEADQMKIYVARHIGFTVHLKGRPTSYTSVSEDVEDRLDAGTRYRIRSDRFSEPDSTYGHLIRKVLPNVLKPSDLDYGKPDLDAKIDLSSPLTIGDALVQVGEKTNIEVLADARVAKLPISVFGSSCSCRDVLKALALSVTGTYRKVGSIYELTSDIEGIGTREAKIALWVNGVNTALKGRLNEWRRRIGQSKGFQGVGYSPSDPAAPTPEMKKWLAENPNRTNDMMLPFNAMPVSWQRILTAGAKRYDQVAIDQARPGEFLTWKFVLPSGDKLEYGMGASLNSYTSVFGEPSSSEPPTAAHIKLKPENRFAICLVASSPDAAKIAVGLAAKYGFSELWLQTDSKESLDEAVAEGANLSVKVRLYVRPWDVLGRGSPTQLDYTVVGESPSTIARHFPENLFYAGYYEDASTTPEVKNLYSPFAPDLTQYWTRLTQVASDPETPVVVGGTIPQGYEPIRPSGHGNGQNDVAFFPSQNLGYSSGARSSFLQSAWIDPIDLPNQALDQTRVEHDLPFFPDAATQSEETAWDKFTSAANENAIQSFLPKLNRPLLLEVRRTTRNHLLSTYPSFCEWSPGEPLPATENGRTNGILTGAASMIRLSELVGPKTEQSLSTTFGVLASRPRTNPQALDLTQIPVDHLSQFIERWFAPVKLGSR